MRTMPDKAFDLAIVDPPYGIGKFTYDAHTNQKGVRVKNNIDPDYYKAAVERVEAHQRQGQFL